MTTIYQKKDENEKKHQILIKWFSGALRGVNHLKSKFCGVPQGESWFKRIKLVD